MPRRAPLVPAQPVSFHDSLSHSVPRLFRCAHRHFGGQNVYLDEVEKNIKFAEEIRKEGEKTAKLNRLPPNLLKE